MSEVTKTRYDYKNYEIEDIHLKISLPDFIKTEIETKKEVNHQDYTSNSLIICTQINFKSAFLIAIANHQNSYTGIYVSGDKYDYQKVRSGPLKKLKPNFKGIGNAFTRHVYEVKAVLEKYP